MGVRLPCAPGPKREVKVVQMFGKGCFTITGWTPKRELWPNGLVGSSAPLPTPRIIAEFHGNKARNKEWATFPRSVGHSTAGCPEMGVSIRGPVVTVAPPLEHD